MFEIIKLIVNEIPSSNNKYLGRGRKGNQYEYQAEKKLWAWLILEAAKGQRQAFDGKCIVSIKYFFPTRARRDPDNYSGKFILDGLVGCGILSDDSFNHVRLVLDGDYDKKNPRTEITVREE